MKIIKNQWKSSKTNENPWFSLIFYDNAWWAAGLRRLQGLCHRDWCPNACPSIPQWSLIPLNAPYNQSPGPFRSQIANKHHVKKNGTFIMESEHRKKTKLYHHFQHFQQQSTPLVNNLLYVFCSTNNFRKYFSKSSPAKSTRRFSMFLDSL